MPKRIAACSLFILLFTGTAIAQPFRVAHGLASTSPAQRVSSLSTTFQNNSPSRTFASNGMYDFVALLSSPSINVRIGTGTGTFTGGTNLTPGTSSSLYVDRSSESIQIADLNGDGKPDIAACDEGTNTISIFLGNGDGTFGARTPVTVGTNPIAIAVLDYNQDGRLDLAVVNSGSNTVSILTGNGNGGFTIAQTITVSSSPDCIAVADLNGDDYPDIVVTSSANLVFVALGASTGTFGTPVQYSPASPKGTVGFRSLVLAPLTGHDTLDIAAVSGQDSTIYIFRGKGDGTFLTTTTNLSTSLYNPVSIVAYDFNRDGYTDLAVANYTQSSVTIRLGAAGGSFQTPSVVTVPGTSTNGVSVADVDGDGNMDIIANSSSALSAFILKNSGTGSFSYSSTIALSGSPLSVAVGDINKDRADIPSGQMGIDDNTSPYYVGFGFAGGTTGFGWFNQLTPSTYPATLTSVRARFSTNVAAGAQIRLQVFTDTENNGPNNAQTPTVNQTVTVSRDADNWSTFTLTTPVTINSGSFAVGFLDNLGTGLAYPATPNLPGLSSPPGSRSFETDNNGTTYRSEFARGNPDFFFSFLIRGVLASAGTITVNTPAQNWATSYTTTIKWSTLNLSGNVNIKLSTNGGSTFATTIASNVSNTGSYSWSVPSAQSVSTTCILRVESASNTSIYGLSGIFSIVSGTNITTTQPVTVSVAFSSTPKNSNEYRLVSFPGNLNSVTVSQLNFAGTQDQDWKMFREPGKNTQSFISLGKSNTLKTGEGYWFLQKGALSKTVSFTTPSLSSDATATITLSGLPYSIIGNPFNVRVPWASVLSVNNLPSNTPLYSWNGSWSSTNAYLQPGVGYYINSTSITTLKIPYAGFGFPAKAPPSDFPNPDWRLQLIFATENSRDDDNYIGIVPGSSQGKDQYEFNKPPLVFDMSFLYMKRPAWDATDDMFFADYRPEVSNGQTWEFDVTNPDKSIGTLTVAGVGQIPVQYDAFLVNEETGISVDLRRQQSMHYGLGTAQGHFKIIVGPPGYVTEQTKQFTPAQFGLKQNYPNPFNPATTITFTLPTVSPVRLEVFSLLGQKVKTLASGEYGSGVHQVVWAGDDDSGRKVASGVYLYRLNVGVHGSFVNKMLLTK